VEDCKSKGLCVLYSALTVRDFVPRLELLKLSKDFR